MGGFFFFLISELWGRVVPQTVFRHSGSVGQFFYVPLMLSTLFFAIGQMVRGQSSLNMVT